MAYDEVGGLYGDRYFQRYTLRVNNDFNITQKLSATLDFNVKRTKHHMPQFTPFGMMRYMPAIYAGVWDDGRIAEGKSGANPYGLMKLGGTTENGTQHWAVKHLLISSLLTDLKFQQSLLLALITTSSKHSRKQPAIHWQMIPIQ